jgi:hypothetical protein
MSIFNITDATCASAFCNAMDAARQSDRRAAQHRPVTPDEAGKAQSHAAIWASLRTILRPIARLLRYSDPRHTAAATR